MNIEHLRRRVFIRLASERGSFVYKPTIGSRLHELTRGKHLSAVHELAPGYIREALQPEIRRGFVLGVENVRVTVKTLHSVTLEVDVVANNREILTVPVRIN